MHRAVSDGLPIDSPEPKTIPSYSASHKLPVEGLELEDAF